MFNFKEQIAIFQNHYREHGTIYNDTPKTHPSGYLPVIKISSPQDSQWKVLGVHKLTSSENDDNNKTLIEVYCKQNEREGMRAVYFDWQGRHGTEIAPGPIFMAQKGKDELVDLPIHIPMKIKVWIQNGDTVQWFHSEWPNEDGNVSGHHSYFVCFQERAWFDEIDVGPIPDPDPTSDPDTDPTKKLILLIDKNWLKKKKADDEGFIRVYD